MSDSRCTLQSPCGRLLLIEHAQTTIGTLFVPPGHNHDPNRHTMVLECSECGDRWAISYWPLCHAKGCDYNRPSPSPSGDSRE